jgi:hypothetical protein
MTQRDWIWLCLGSGQAFLVAGVFALHYASAEVGVAYCLMGATHLFGAGILHFVEWRSRRRMEETPSAPPKIA